MKRKLNLSQLDVQSFTTTEKVKHVKGGEDTYIGNCSFFCTEVECPTIHVTQCNGQVCL
ncbi:pinensin family lanthipeptide [Roseivirga sp. BDSF3-8]|uniref:pinensin family lanthipeptide n=1 Tax=Roseivirga sp. BDSF3-8 TaxID=3241598 RepID=UPI003531BCAF